MSDRVTSRTRPLAPPHETRERILRVAAEAWHASSFDGIGTAEICRRAKVHKGSFFHFFPSKDDLLLAVLDRYAEQIGEHLVAGPFAPDVPPLARFERFFARLGAQMQQEIARDGCIRGCPIGNVVLELATRSPAVRAAAARVFDRMRTVFEQALDEALARGELLPGTDPRTAATALLAYLQGLAVLGKAYGAAGGLDRLAGRVPALLGVAARA